MDSRQPRVVFADKTPDASAVSPLEASITGIRPSPGPRLESVNINYDTVKTNDIPRIAQRPAHQQLLLFAAATTSTQACAWTPSKKTHPGA